MKKTEVWLLIMAILSMLIGCKKGNQQHSQLITVNVTENYPVKELILQDFMDVEYVSLETTDEFLCGNNLQDVGNKYIIMTNNASDGNIYVFDRSGKAVKKINRKGQGGEEYVNVSCVVLDEENNELYVNDIYAKRILIYDLNGNFKRKLSIHGDYLFADMYDFDRNNLICRDAFNENSVRAFHSGQSFMLLSKQDGTITKVIQIPYEQKKTMVVRTYEKEKDMHYFYIPRLLYPIMPYLDDYILTEYSADTLYSYSPNHIMKPFAVRTPSIQSMNPEFYLMPSLLTEQYYFMRVIKKEFPDFPSTYIMYDKQENTLFRYKVYNSDYTNEKEAFLLNKPLKGDIPSWQYLEAWELVQDYKNGNLQGRLREIASTLDEEDNPVIMLIKRKR